MFLIFLNMKVCCLLTLESPHLGDSNEYKQHTIISIKNVMLNYPRFAVMGFFSEGLQNECNTAVVNKASVFEPL